MVAFPFSNDAFVNHLKAAQLRFGSGFICSVCASIVFSIFVGSVNADSPSTEEKSAVRLVNLQSQDIELPEDFLVKVDGGKLQVALVSMGVIESKMSTRNLLVRLFDSDGEEQTATTNQQGIAEFKNVKADQLHGLLVAGEEFHAALPVMTVSMQSSNETGIGANNFRLPVTEVNKKEILASVNRDMPPSKGPTGEPYSSNEFTPKITSPYSVKLQSDGSLQGKVVVADRELAEKLRYAKLTFLRNNQVITKTDSNPADGSFNVSGLSEGVHGVIAAGPAGYASFAFDVLRADAMAIPSSEGIFGKPVSLIQTDANKKLYVVMCPQRVARPMTDRIREAYAGPIPNGLASQPGLGGGFGGGGFGGGGFGGGGSFGGGSSGGGGLLGGGGSQILGLAGLAAVAAVVANDINKNNNSVVSPITRQ